MAYFINEIKNPNVARPERLSVVRNVNTGGYDLQITGLSRAEDVGKYTCIVNTMPPKEYRVNLNLYESPSNISISESYTENGILRIRGTESSSLTLICLSVGGVPPANVTWKRGSQILSSGISQTSYTFAASSNDDLQNYTCVSNSPALTSPMMKDVQIYLKLMPQRPLISSLFVTKENQQLTVSCSSSGSRPAATLSWRFRGSSLPATTTFPPMLDTLTHTYTVSSTLTVTVNRGDNGRNVTCIASNIALSAGTQSKQVVSIHFGPDRIGFDGTTGLQENSAMNLRCTADESNNASIISWRNNSSPLSVNTAVSTSAGIYNGVRTSQTYTKVLSRHDHRSVITCTASNGDNVANNSTTLDVKYSPRVSLSPSNLMVVVGQRDVILQCTLLEANPQQVSYTWNPATSTSNVLKITEITKVHEGQYECEAENTVGRSPIARTQITVQYSPEIESFVPRTPEEVKDSVTVRCNATAKPAVNRMYWRNPNGATASNSNILQINNIRRDQSGVYTCHAENTLTPTGQQPYTGRGQQTLTVDVLYGPSLENTRTNFSSIMHYKESNSSTFPSIMCHSICNPVCHLTWNGPRSSSSAVLNLGLIKRDKNGTYICTARNIVNSSPRSASITIHIIVLYPPNINITISYGINTVNEGERVQIMCTVDSQPYSNVTWHRKGERLGHQDISMAYSQLVISSAHCYDTGNFSCHAENGIGIPATKSTPLKVKSLAFVIVRPGFDSRSPRCIKPKTR
ncbi:B-cell receptor CD22-like [Saccostrea echinata]|uniref:B-cell receptor CD22-like n=1 Tax=Saccostrea echinata TaxID=191078 RepID=UPI002A838A00|nr:B-cell receptor CD22-like [Saccostrea echinata]